MAPVSRRFRALCLHPQLLRRVECHQRQDGRRLAALCGLLEGHGEHVRHLSITGAPAEAADQLACCLSRAPSALQTLESAAACLLPAWRGWRA